MLPTTYGRPREPKGTEPKSTLPEPILKAMTPKSKLPVSKLCLGKDEQNRNQGVRKDFQKPPRRKLAGLHNKKTKENLRKAKENFEKLWKTNKTI